MISSKLTQRWVDDPPAVPAGSNELLVWDSRLDGFGATVYGNGSVRFFMTFHAPGGALREYHIGGPAPVDGGVSVDEARETAEAVRSTLARGGEPMHARRRKRAGRTNAAGCGLALAELVRLMQALRRDPDPVAAAAIMLLMLTGCRKEEVLGLHWDDVRLGDDDWELASLNLSRTRPTEALRVPLSDTAREILRTLPRPAGECLVFPSTGDRRRPAELGPAWARAKRAAGLAYGHRIGDVRRAYAGLLLGVGCSIHDIAFILRQKSPDWRRGLQPIDMVDFPKAYGLVAELIEPASSRQARTTATAANGTRRRSRRRVVRASAVPPAKPATAA